MQSLSFVSYFITMSFILYCYIPQLLKRRKLVIGENKAYLLDKAIAFESEVSTLVSQKLDAVIQVTYNEGVS